VLVDETLQGTNVFEHQFTHVPFCVQNTGQRLREDKDGDSCRWLCPEAMAEANGVKIDIM
jgi:hypothetical protein